MGGGESVPLNWPEVWESHHQQAAAAAARIPAPRLEGMQSVLERLIAEGASYLEAKAELSQLAKEA